MGFIEQTIAKARANRKTIVLPESLDRRVLEAAARLTAEQITDVVLIGEPEEIHTAGAGLDLSGARIVNPLSAGKLETYTMAYYEMRKNKGVTLEQAAQTILNPLFYGVMMVKFGEADGMVAGAANSTAATLRPALQILRTAPGTQLVSSFFMMVVPACQYGLEGIFLFADSGLVENPDANQLSEIALSSAQSFRQLTGGEPRVAMLSYSTKGSAKSEKTAKVVEATRLAREKAPLLLLDGELQLDAAIDADVAAAKAPGSAVAGSANVLIFPDLDAGNIGYKIVQRLANAEAYGPITQGIARPVNDLSRGCTADDIVGVAAITAVQAAD